MNRITSFRNAAEFNEIFGMVEHGNGVKSRRNKILLAFYKSKEVWNYCRDYDRWDLLSIKDMQTLYTKVMQIIQKESRYNYNAKFGYYNCTLNGNQFASRIYQVSKEGICLDGKSAEQGFVRYLNMERGGKPYKMAAGKFFTHCIKETPFGNIIHQQVLVWICEKLVESWKVYVADKCPKYELHIGKTRADFSKIYNDRYYDGYYFGSCMTNEEQHHFYVDAVEARAAWLEDDCGNIVARCIIFDNVKDEENKTWRLCERQYSANCVDLLKRQLVSALIKVGEIDAYKQIGADCRDAKSFVDNEGNSLSHKKFRIECHLEPGDTLSYQDSFKWFNYAKQMAYNYSAIGCECILSTTDRRFEGSTEYDEYHDRYVREVMWVHYNGREISCDYNDLDDFRRYKNGEYYHEDEFIECDECGESFPDPELYPCAASDWCVSYLTGECYCSSSCMERAEERYKEENWFYSDIDDEYFEEKSELTDCLVWNELRQKYIMATVAKSNIPNHLKLKNLFIHNGVLVDDIEPMLSADKICDELARINVELQTV